MQASPQATSWADWTGYLDAHDVSDLTTRVVRWQTGELRAAPGGQWELWGGERAARESRQQIGRRIDDGEEEARRILTDLQPGTCVILGNAPTWEVFQPSTPRRGWVPVVVFYRGELGMSPDGVMLLGADGRRYLATLCFAEPRA
jgi:hypothetical protein